MKRADFLHESLSGTASAIARRAASSVKAKSNDKKRGNGSKADRHATEPEAPKKTERPPQHPEALIAFMMKDWKPRDKRLPARMPNADAFAKRRSALSKRFPGDWIVIPTGHEKVRANDTVYRFRPGSDFFYLTGNLEPDCVLVLEPKRGGGHNHVLFVEPNPGRSDKTFFTDHAKGELWVGPRLGVRESRARFGVHECRGIPDLPAYLKSIKQAAKKTVRVLRGFSDKVDRSLTKSNADAELGEFLSEMRLIKDDLEIRELQAVVASTRRGFEDVIVSLRKAKTEREIEGAFNVRARVEGNDVGYGTIAAGGANACILHWTRNDAPLKKRELLLLDAGVEGNQLYTADITRTLPISGKFSKEQREVYDLVCAAQAAALAAVKPGNDFMEPNRAAQRVLAEGLTKMGILRDAEQALKPEQQLQKRYTLHNTSHMLGIDVHDCAKARQEVYRYGKLVPGMVLTIEPGLYFQPDDLTVPEKYRGIGVRIEDDVLVTKTGMKNLSQSIPRTSKDVEAWMAKIWSTVG
ncbi:MAG: aminopeptidase P family protein [Polyangiaceae bacterium]|nr:aminopeptidase P family protein [Polyangiaceae bacterium]